MKRHFIILLSLTITTWISCGKSGIKTSEERSLSELNSELESKKEALSILQSEIVALTEQIAQLDPSLREKARLVSTMTIQPQVFERYVNVQGIVFADKMVNVTSEVPGRVISVNYEEGDYVRKGQLVATLDLESLEKQRAEIITSLQLATDIYERQSRLWAQNIGSEIQYLQAKNNKERLEKSLETIDYNLTKSKIYSPLSGTVDREFVKSGEIASPGMPIISILNTSDIKVTADIPERYLSLLKRGQTVELEFPAIKESRSGTITLLGRSIDPANRTLKVDIEIQGRSELMKPNLLVEVRFQELSIPDVLVVPVEYVLQEVDGKEFVYIAETVNGELRAKKIYVFTGEASEGMIAIEEGLTEENEMITKGARNVSNGELIRIQNISNSTDDDQEIAG
jgi:RND family efflux transporter MFP subunit